MTASRTPILFDLDGTLVDSARSIAAALSAVAIARGGAAIDPAQVRPLVSLGVGVLVATVLADLAGDSAADIAACRAALSSQAADPADLYPGAAETVRALAAAGHPLAIVTNKPEALSRKLLDELYLLACFGTVVGGDTCRTAKPDPLPLHHALATIAPWGQPADAVMIGDSDVDGLAARAVGCRFVRFTGGYGPASPDAYPVAGQFNVFAELPPLLAAPMTLAPEQAA